MNRKLPSTVMPIAPSSDWSHQCTLYLLGELHDQSLISFEQQLAGSPELGEILIAQAALIDELSKVQTGPLAMPSPTTGYRWKRTATLVALSACLAWALLSIQPQGQGLRQDQGQPRVQGPLSLVDTTETEALLIAKIWADDSSVTATEADILANLTEESLLDVEDEAETDSAISWMAVAVAAEAESLVDGDANDG